MKDHALFDKIDLHLVRVLNTVLTERSVSRAAIRLGMYQPAVSAALKRLRALAGDPLLVRSGAGIVPTEAGLRMIEPSASILRATEVLFSDARGFDPATATSTFSLAASDYLDPLFLPQLVAQIKTQAPLCHISASGSGQGEGSDATIVGAGCTGCIARSPRPAFPPRGQEHNRLPWVAGAAFLFLELA